MARTIAKDHNEKRDQILTMAAQVFAEQGYHKASVSQVARACSISKANIYHYYESKDDILFDILDTYLRDLRDRVCGLDLDGMAPAEKFRATVLEILLAYQGADSRHRVQTTTIGFLSLERQETLRDYQRDLVMHFARIVKENAPEVFVNDRGKLRSTTMSVFGMLNWYYMWAENADRAAREEYAEIVTRLTLDGIHSL